MFDSSNDGQHRPPSAHAGGRFLALLGMQLVAFSLILLLSQQMARVNFEFIGQHPGLAAARQSIDRAEAVLDRFSRAAQGSSDQERLFAELSAGLNSAGQSESLLQRTSVVLPAETAEVRQASAALSSAWEDSRRSGRAGYGEDINSSADRLERALNALLSGVDRLDDASYERFVAIQNIRWIALGLTTLAWLMVLIAFAYAVKVFRQLRREEMARFQIESELIRERSALEQRVQARTAALEEEVKERQRAEGLNRGRNRMLEMVARNDAVADTFKVLAEMVAEYRSTWICTVHSLSSGSLKLMASAGLNEKVLHHFRSIPAEYSGAPENVALATRQSYSVEDLGAEKKPWSELLRANGLLSVRSEPFFAPDATPLGTLTVYTLLRWKPSASDIEMLEMACHMAALVLERGRLQAQLIDHAYHDSLTGLPNRRLGVDRLSSALSRAARVGGRVAILWADLDRFKQINDLYGHPVGDAVLQQTARRFSGRIRASDTLARMGGDEFMGVLEGDWDREGLEIFAAGLAELLIEPMQIGELELRITASIGLAIYPDDGKTVEILSQYVDQAMYAAKSEGGGVRAFSQEMDRLPAERRELEAEMSRALETGGFTLAYQPRCLPGGELAGFEALLRFRSPRLGEISPAEFIPVAEEAQLIVPIGEWVLREVCRQNQEWERAGSPGTSIGVNISALQFGREDFADTVAEILRETGQQGDMLVLELTESIVMRNFAESARQMKRLKRLGIRIAIDDFGTGYSSLSYLHRLPIDVLKIDRSFMENLNEPEGTRPIIEAVLSMAHTFGLQVVAEGVETFEQLSTLRQCGCDEVQGYYFSRAVEANVAAGFLEAGRLEGCEGAVL